MYIFPIKKIDNASTKFSAIRENQIIKLNEFEQKFKRLLFLKKINVSELNSKIENNKVCIYLNLFFQTQKLIKYKNKVKKIPKKKFENQIRFLKGIQKIYSNINTTTLVIKNLNTEIDNFSIKYFYSIIKKFASVLFARRFNLYIDFIKVTALFVQKKINSAMFLNYLGQIFAKLPKKKHSRFFFFLKFLFQEILNVKNTKLQGLKLIVNGKLQGKTRASVLKITAGNVPIQTINKNIVKSQVHVYTLYGAFGFTLWTNIKD